MRTLFRIKSNQKSSINLKLFCDEITLKDWIYIGMLVVPEAIEKF